MREPRSSAAGAATSAWLTTPRLAFALAALTFAIYGWGFTRSVGEFGDAFHHLMNGVFMHDALLDMPKAIQSPREYALAYYRHYPAVSLGYYPPGFALVSGVMMLIFGVSGATAQFAVVLAAVALSLFALAWFQLRFDPLWAAIGTLLLVTTPLLVHWGRDIMLEIPALALMMGAMWAFESLLRMERPTWKLAMVWALLSAMAFWTRQTTIMLLGMYLLATVTSKRWAHLRRPPIIAGLTIVIVAAAGLIVMTLKLGGDNVGHTVGFTPAHAAERFNFAQWQHYLRWLPDVIGLPILIASIVGLLVAAAHRTRGLSVLLIWILVFYVVHSYFKAQEARYACLWVAPFYALAVYGFQFVAALGRTRPPAAEAPPPAALTVLAALALVTYGVSRVGVVRFPFVPDAYQRAAADLRDMMPPYSCLSFLPDRPGRPVVCYRLAAEERRLLGKDILSFGRMTRANQVLHNWPERWPDFQAIDESLKSWNIKYILLETPHPLDLGVGDDVIEQAVEGVLALGDFREIRHYEVNMPQQRMGHRRLVLYERISNIPYNPAGVPAMHTWRIPMNVAPAASRPTR